MPTKRRAKKRGKPISDKTRAADDQLREALRKADLRKFDTVLAKAVTPTPARRTMRAKHPS